MFFLGGGGSRQARIEKLGGSFLVKHGGHRLHQRQAKRTWGTRYRTATWKMVTPSCVATGSCRILWKICVVRTNIYIKEVQSDCFWHSWVAVLRWAPNRYQKGVDSPILFFFKCQPKRNLKVDFNFHNQSKCCNPNSFELFHFSRTFHPLRCWTWTGPPEPPTPVEEAELSLQAKQVGVFFVGWDFVSQKLDITFHWSSSQYRTLHLMLSRVWFEKLGLRSVFSTVAVFFHIGNLLKAMAAAAVRSTANSFLNTWAMNSIKILHSKERI